MPTYEYACEDCGHEFEQFQSITARPLRKCPVCGARKLRRLIGSGGGVIFKGSGFYQTDYRSESYKKAAEAEKSARTSSATGDSTSKTGDGKKDKTPKEAKPAKATKPATETSSTRKAS
jgi:putative FmdB family regulatory protein